MDWPLGVFASIDAGLGVQLDVAAALEIETIQLHAPAAATRTADQASAFLQRLRELNIQLTAVFGGFAGESYASIPITAETVGLVPAETRAARTQEMMEIADFARMLQCDVVALHLGFVPAADDPEYANIVEVTRQLCAHCAGNSQRLHLETGQETAEHLLKFLADVACDNLHVNFDPANMILYGTGEPIEAAAPNRTTRPERALQRCVVVGPAGRNVGTGSAAGRRRRGHRAVPANIGRNRLPGTAND